MCSASQIADPLGLTYRYKWADPAGITKTAVGDPTGAMRKGHQEQADYEKSWADYNAAMAAPTYLGGSGTGEKPITSRKGYSNGSTLLG